MEFVLDAIVTGESGRHTLIGRCGDAPIHVGDEFHVAYRYTVGIAPKKTDARGDEQQVVVHINEIHAYGKKLETLGQGMTGALVVSGTALEKLAPGMVLGGQATTVQPTISADARHDG